MMTNHAFRDDNRSHSQGAATALPTTAAGDPNDQVAQLFRPLLDEDNPVSSTRWPAFLVAFAEELGRASFTRRHMLDLLGRVDPSRSWSSRIHLWEEGLRQRLADNEYITDERSRLRIDLQRCRADLARLDNEPTPGDAGLDGTANGSALIGRESETRRILDLLHAGTRIITISGIGGIGKTRLANHVAHTSQPQAIVVDLLGVDTVEDLALTISEQLDVSLSGDPVECIGDILSIQAPPLLVLDNFEQLVGSSAVAVASWSEYAPFLITSRVPLGVGGEVTVDLRPLAVPEAGSETSDILRADSVRLFLRSAGRSDRWAQPHAAALAQVVRRLNGIPLALELAAARIPVLSPAQLLERIADNIDVLDSSRPDLPERQRTLRATIEWSRDQLSPAGRFALACASVFPGPFTLEAFESVVGTVDGPAAIDLLHTLVRSGLVSNPDEEAAEPQFSCLELIRDLATREFEDLSAADQGGIRERYYNWCAAVAAGIRQQSAEPGLDLKALDVRAIREQTNLEQLVLQASDAGDVARAADGLFALGVIPFPRWTTPALAQQARELLDRAEPAQFVHLAITLGYLATRTTSMEPNSEDLATLQRAVEMLESGELTPERQLRLAETRYLLVRTDLRRFDPEHAPRMLEVVEAAADTMRRAGDRTRLTYVLGLQGSLMQTLGNTEQAGVLLRSAIAMADELGLTGFAVTQRVGYAMALGNEADEKQMRRLLSEAADGARSTSCQHQCLVANRQAMMESRFDHPRSAEAFSNEAEVFARRSGRPKSLSETLWVRAGVMRRAGRLEESLRWYTENKMLHARMPSLGSVCQQVEVAHAEVLRLMNRWSEVDQPSIEQALDIPTLHVQFRAAALLAQVADEGSRLFKRCVELARSLESRVACQVERRDFGTLACALADWREFIQSPDHALA